MSPCPYKWTRANRDIYRTVRVYGCVRNRVRTNEHAPIEIYAVPYGLPKAVSASRRIRY